MALGAALLVAGCTNDMSGMPVGDPSTAPSSAASTSAEFNDA